MRLKDINTLFEYKSDGDMDKWTIMAGKELKGDCEDYALTVLYYVICNGNWYRLWWKLIFGNARLCYVDSRVGGHAVLKVGDKYIDNWTRAWVDKTTMEELGHQFKEGYFKWYHVAYKLFIG